MADDGIIWSSYVKGYYVQYKTNYSQFKIIHVLLFICIQALKLYFVFQVSREAEYLPIVTD